MRELSKKIIQKWGPIMINNEELKKIAELAKLYVSESELCSLVADINDIVAYANMILEVQTEDNGKLLGITLESLRDDIQFPSFPKEAILKNTDNKEYSFFSLMVRRHE